MRYWFTTHYPHKSPTHPWSIYVKERYLPRARQISKGDSVLFYELRGRERDGRSAIIKLAKVSDRLQENRHREGSIDEGDEVWGWEIPCAEHEDLFVTREEVYKALGWPSTKPPIVVGGFLELDQKQFSTLTGAHRWKSN